MKNKSSSSSGSSTTTTASGSTPSISSNASTVLTTPLRDDAITAAVPDAGLPRSLLPTGWQDTVREVKMANCKEASVTLAHAFATDDYAQYLVDTEGEGTKMDEESKWKLHADILRYTVASHLLSGLVTTAGPDFDSVALWYVFLFSYLSPSNLLTPFPLQSHDIYIYR